MAATPDALGRLFNIAYTASGRGVKLVDGSAVTFVSADAASGDQTLTFRQRDSSGVNSEIDLNIFDVPAGTVDAKSRVYVGSDVGDGPWTEVAATSDNVATGGGTTNDTVVVTVRAEQLADGYDIVECTAANGGTCVAILHDLNVQRKPSNLRGISVA